MDSVYSDSDAASNVAIGLNETSTQSTLYFLSRAGGVGAMLSLQAVKRHGRETAKCKTGTIDLIEPAKSLLFWSCGI